MDMRILPGGRLRAIDDDALQLDDATGWPVRKRRASHVEVVEAGPFANWFYADMSPLGPVHQLCLWPPFRRRQDALAAEHSYIDNHWLKEDDAQAQETASAPV